MKRSDRFRLRWRVNPCAASAAPSGGSPAEVFQELEHKRGIARLIECFACSAAAQLQPERSLRLAGAAAALRQTLGAPLTLAEQTKLERSLERALTGTAGATAWLEGWVMSVEKAIEEALALTPRS
jgi:hypothetical protein